MSLNSRRNLRSGMFPFAILNKDHHESRKKRFRRVLAKLGCESSIPFSVLKNFIYCIPLLLLPTWPHIYISISWIYWCEERGLFTQPVCELFSCTIFLSVPPFGPIEGQKWFFQISSQWESQKNQLHLLISAKSSFYLPAFEIFRSCRTASGRRSSMSTWAIVRGGGGMLWLSHCRTCSTLTKDSLFTVHCVDTVLCNV